MYKESHTRNPAQDEQSQKVRVARSSHYLICELFSLFFFVKRIALYRTRNVSLYVTPIVLKLQQPIKVPLVKVHRVSEKDLFRFDSGHSVSSIHN